MRRWRILHASLVQISAATEEGEGRQSICHFCQHIYGTLSPKVAGVQVPIGDGVHSDRGWRRRRVVDKISNEALLAKLAHDVGGWHRGQGAQVEGRRMP